MDQVAESALLWTSAAELIEQAGARGSPDHLAETSQLLADIATIETSAMTALSALPVQKPDHYPRHS